MVDTDFATNVLLWVELCTVTFVDKEEGQPPPPSRPPPVGVKPPTPLLRSNAPLPRASVMFLGQKRAPRATSAPGKSIRTGVVF